MSDTFNSKFNGKMTRALGSSAPAPNTISQITDHMNTAPGNNPKVRFDHYKGFFISSGIRESSHKADVAVTELKRRFNELGDQDTGHLAQKLKLGDLIFRNINQLNKGGVKKLEDNFKQFQTQYWETTTNRLNLADFLGPRANTNSNNVVEESESEDHQNDPQNLPDQHAAPAAQIQDNAQNNVMSHSNEAQSNYGFDGLPPPQDEEHEEDVGNDISGDPPHVAHPRGVGGDNLQGGAALFDGQSWDKDHPEDADFPEDADAEDLYKPGQPEQTPGGDETPGKV